MLSSRGGLGFQTAGTSDSNSSTRLGVVIYGLWLVSSSGLKWYIRLAMAGVFCLQQLKLSLLIYVQALDLEVVSEREVV